MIYNSEYLNQQNHSKAKIQQNINKDSAQNHAINMAFNSVLQQKVVEGMSAATEQHLKKKKKDTSEVFDELEEEKSELYENLEIESRIRKVIRKINIKEL